jgi:ferric-dicitrate binding protein FerR (iron transport regulator)
VFAGDRLETDARSGATLTLAGRDSLALDRDSAIWFPTAGGELRVELERGRLAVKAAGGPLRSVTFSRTAVSVRVAPSRTREFQVARIKTTDYVYSRAGEVTVLDAGYATALTVAEGKVAVLPNEFEPQAQAAQTTPAATQSGAARQLPPAARRAGEITAVIPTDYIVRGGRQAEGAPRDTIAWEDTLLTEARGRVRMVLDDGSILSVGSGSRLQVVEHNSASQQTRLQMEYGRLRAQVVKLTRPQAAFEIRTRTAVCGVLGTDFYIEATEKSTRVIVFKGVVRVTPLVAGALAGVAAGAGTGGATVSAGQATTAVAGGVSAPTAATAAQIQTAVTSSATQAAGQAAAAAAAGTTGGAASAGASTAAVVAAGVVPAAVTAAIVTPTMTETGPISP